MGSGPLKERLQVAVWSQGLLPTLGAGSLGHPRTKSTHLPSPPAKPSWALARGRRCGSLSRHPASSQNPKLPCHMGASSARAQASQQLACSRHMGDAARNISCPPPMNPRAAAVVPSLALFSPSLQHFSVLLRVSIPSPSTPPTPAPTSPGWSQASGSPEHPTEPTSQLQGRASRWVCWNENSSDHVLRESRDLSGRKMIGFFCVCLLKLDKITSKL